MPLKILQRWPKSCGFDIYGKGPSYVIGVEKGGIAYRAGLVPGDQILEVDGRDVTTMSADKIRTLARTGPHHTPSLEVVSCLQTCELSRDSTVGYGMSVLNDKQPVRVGAVDYAGPAYQAGIRAGDVILEVNNRSPVRVDTLSTFLAQGSGKITLLTIPVGRTANMVSVDKGLSRVTAPDSRLHKARDLHAKLDLNLGNDYVAKMAVVNGLKRYAEDRDVTILCDVLNDNLKTSKQRGILKQIRLLIPPSQRGEFDDVINIFRVGTTSRIRPSSTLDRNRLDSISQTAGSDIVGVKGHTAAATVDVFKLGQTKIIQVIREGGSFGFIIKASNPAFIESVDQYGAAERSGLQAGDFIMKLNGIDVSKADFCSFDLEISHCDAFRAPSGARNTSQKCDHDRLVQMLQDSGSAPTLEILRCPKGLNPSVQSWVSSSGSSCSSTSSHDSMDNVVYADDVTDREGVTFRNKMNFLLTPKERSHLKRTIRNYDITRNIVDLYNNASSILDSPSKKVLWSFLFILLSQPHREYVSHRVSLSWDDLMEVVRCNNRNSDQPEEDHETGEQEPELSDFPASFQKQLEFLLTSNERIHFNQCLKDYLVNTDLGGLVNGLETILDTPSKRILWRLVLPRLTDGHREVMRGRLDIQGQHTETGINRAPIDHMASKDLLFVSDLGGLVNGLETILDTPSKRILWRLVLPRLTDGHREVMRGRLDIQGQHTASAPLNLTSMDSYIGPVEPDQEPEPEPEPEQEPPTPSPRSDIPHTDEDVLYGRSKGNDFNDSEYEGSDDPDGSQFGDDVVSGKGYKVNLVKELEETKRAVQEVRDVLLAQGKEKDDNFYDENLEKDLEYLEARRYVTVIPVGHPALQGQQGQQGTQGLQGQQRTPFKSGSQPGQQTTHHQTGGGGITIPDFPTGRRMSSNHRLSFGGMNTGHQGGVHFMQGMHDTLPQGSSMLKDTRIDGSSDEDNDSDGDGYGNMYNPIGGKEEGNMAGPGLSNSYNQSALSALRELDDAMADEHTDLDNGSPRPSNMGEDNNEATPTADDVINQRRQRRPSIITPPPPPPPPLPPSFSLSDNKQTGAMNVKRINWEKLDNKRVENTIWEKLNDQELKEVVRFLELESQFSTKPSRKRESEKKKEILIMDRKKAYNISILLGHVKMTVGEVIKSLYQMDEEILSPELMGQLLAFAPSRTEIAKYAEYQGSTNALTKPDQFALQISQVENYEQRLQALLFKCNFTEKADEMRENLETIRMASQQLRESKKLARLLEVILAMGNYLNKGNHRVGEAAGFRITFLTQLDITKTSDQKSSFLHVLADAAYSRFPDVLSLVDELPSIEKAAKVSVDLLNDDIQALKKGLKDASTALQMIRESHSRPVDGDRFQDVMVHFIAESSDELQSIVRMQTASREEFATTLKFFGESPDSLSADLVFEIFSEFIKNFERAHRHNLMLKRH